MSLKHDFKRYFDRMEEQKRNEDRFYAMLKERNEHKRNLINRSTTKHDNPFEGPFGIRSQVSRGKRVPVSLPKMPWEK